jgi:hypothetical protein
VPTAPSSRNASPAAGPALHQEPGQTNLQRDRPHNQPLPPARIPGEGSLNNEFIGISPTGEFDFGGLFAEETFSSLFPVRNIAEIEVSPVMVRLRNDRTVLMRIIAARASVRLKEKEILFTGRVRVSSDNAEMATEELVFIPETSRLRTDHPFVLKRGSRTLEGSRLTTDLLLRPQ